MTPKFTLFFYISNMFLAVALPSETFSQQAQVDVLPTSGRNFYRITELTPGQSVVGATYDGALVAYALQRPASGVGPATLRLLWNASIGHNFAFSITVGDISDNSTPEVIVGTASGDVMVFSAKNGTRLFSTRLWHAVYSVAVVDPSGNGQGLLLAGTANGTLALISPQGNVTQTWTFKNSAVRTLVPGKFLTGEASEQLFVAFFPDDSTCKLQALALRKKTLEMAQRNNRISVKKCPDKEKGKCMRPTHPGTVIASFMTVTPYACCLNCTSPSQPSCAAWSWTQSHSICQLFSETGTVQKGECQCGSVHPSPPSPSPSPSPPPPPSHGEWNLEPLNKMWSKPVNTPGVSRSAHGLNAVAARINSVDSLKDTDSIVTSAGLFHPATSTGVIAHFATSPDCPSLQYSDAYRMKCVAVGHFDGDSDIDIQVAVVYGMDVSTYTINEAGVKNGQISSSGCARSNLSFADITTIHAPQSLLKSQVIDAVLMGSAPNGDDNLYHLAFATSNHHRSSHHHDNGYHHHDASEYRHHEDNGSGDPDWIVEVKGLKWQGRVAAINDAIDTIYTLASRNNHTFSPDADLITINLEAYVKFGNDINVSALVQELVERHAYYAKRFPYPDRICFAVEFAFYEDFDAYFKMPNGAKWDHGNAHAPLPRGVLLDQIVKPLVAAGVPFIVRAGHAGAPYIAPSTAKLVVQSAGQYCVGFSTAENHQFTAPHYLTGAVQPIMDICVDEGCRVFFNEKGTFWASVLAGSTSVGDVLLAPRYANVSTPSAEDSNSRTPDLNLAARVGAFMGGAVSAWKARLVADTFAFNRLWDWSKVMVGHPHWRAILVQIVLGARFIDMDCSQRFVNADGSGVSVNGVLEHGLAQLLHLIGKGVVFAPNRKDILLPPIALRTVNATKRFLLSGTGGHDYRNLDTDALDVAGQLTLGRLENMWGMEPTSAQDAGAVLFGRERQFGNFMPVTHPFGGLPMILPGNFFPPPFMTSNRSAVFTTDGDTLRDSQGRVATTQALKKAAIVAGTTMPFNFTPKEPSQGVFVQQIRLQQGSYLVYLINRGYSYPQSRVSGSLSVTSSGVMATHRCCVSDRVSGEELGAFEVGVSALQVMVESGCFRILQIRVC